MSYININEYDYTTISPKETKKYTVALPINVNDGPANEWIHIKTYKDFLNTFGDNPNANTVFGNSWEYAANLLLRGMQVCVRRITHSLTESGENAELLPDVETARAVVKVKDVIGSDIADSNVLSEGLINVTDSAYHSVLNKSFKGEEIDNPLYKYVEYIQDGIKTRNGYANVYDLQTDETNRIVGAFADVLSTESEWNYVGEFVNPHYKYQKFGETTPMSFIKMMNQTVDESTSVPYSIGDFFIDEFNHIIVFSPTPIPNEYLIVGQKQYPDDLKSINTDMLTESHFIDVTFNKDNSKAVNLVWTYSEEGTIVSNHKFINGNKVIDKNTPYKVFETNADLPTKNVGVNYFAPVKSTDSIWLYDGKQWSNTGVKFDELTTVDATYGMEVKVPFVCTNVAINTDIYKHYFNWKDIGENIFIDEAHPNIVYVPLLYWVNSNNEIGTRPHTMLDGANIKINDIVINTNVDVSKSSVDIQVNGHLDIKTEPDYTDTRLVSGKYGITNISTESIKIYSFKINQKNDNGDVSLVYDSGIEKVINSSGRLTIDPLLRIYNTVTNKYLDDPIPKLDSTTNEDRWYFDLEPGCAIYYNRDISSAVVNIKVAGFDDFELACQTLNSASGSYTVALTSLENTCAEVVKSYIPKIEVEEIDYNNIPKKDSNQKFNMFVAEYYYPGYAGNDLNIRIKTDITQGIFIHVYRNQQFLEKIELCSFRCRNGNTGYIYTLDAELDKDKIWKSILSKFNVIINNEIACDSSLIPINQDTVLTPIYGNYVKIYLNKNILLNNPLSLDCLHALYAQNGTAITKLEGGCNPHEEHVLHEVHKCFKPLKDKYRYDITFLTGGTYVDAITYPKVSTNTTYAIDTGRRLIEDAVIEVSTHRQDCVALLDVPYDLPVNEIPSYYAHISTSYGAAYDPWAYIILDSGSTKWMPPSFVQLFAHATSIMNGNSVYLPPAGIKRATVREILKTNHDLSYEYLSIWQNKNTPQYINPIIWINGYDYTIYGQKTLYNIIDAKTVYQGALQDLNVRLVANEIKKLIFKTCIELTFELNNIMTWNEFKSKIEPTLSVMEGEGVLTKYSVIMGNETMTVADLNSGHVVGTVRVAIARAATDWDINFELTPNNVTFSEYDYNSLYSN